MNNRITATAIESLTILYLQNQDLSGKSPEELYQMYIETYDKFKNINENTDDTNSQEPQEARVFKKSDFYRQNR